MSAEDKGSGVRSGGELRARKTSDTRDIDLFLKKAQLVRRQVPAGGGRLLFAMDATASREGTWDSACHLQAEMFSATQEFGGLCVQLLYFGGFEQCRVSNWTQDSRELLRLMQKVRCVPGRTQIEKVLCHALAVEELSALVFVGDAQEEEAGVLKELAGQLRILKRPCFMFQEGFDLEVEAGFRDIAQLSGGAYARFEPGADTVFRRLLAGVAAYASGGVRALRRLKQAGTGVNDPLVKLLQQVERK